MEAAEQHCWQPVAEVVVVVVARAEVVVARAPWRHPLERVDEKL